MEGAFLAGIEPGLQHRTWRSRRWRVPPDIESARDREAAGLGGRPPLRLKACMDPEHMSRSNCLTDIFYRVARTTLRGSRSGLSVSHWNCLILGYWRPTSPSRKADLRRRSGLAGTYRASISARHSLSTKSQGATSPATSSARRVCPLLACSPHRTRHMLGRCSLGRLA